MDAPRTVLLDIDGTLLDSNAAHAAAWAEALAVHGRAVPVDDVRPLIGMGSDKLLPALGVAADSPLAEDIERLKGERFARRLPSLKPTPGARRLVSCLRAHDIQIVAATSADGDEVAALLTQAGVADLMSAAVHADDVARSKPDPDVVSAALRVAGVQAADALLVGDTPFDVEAAARIGVRTIALRSGGWWSDASFARAVAIYDNPAHLADEFDRSPLAGRVSHP